MPTKAEKLLEKMRESPAGWRRKDFDTLYLGFGFVFRSGRSHDIVTHPEFPELRDTLPRHAKELSKAYAVDAVKLVERLVALTKAREEEQSDDE